MRGLFFIFLSLIPLNSQELPEKIQEIMQKKNYQHAHFGLLVKDTHTNEILYAQNPNQLFLPGSTTKIFTVASLYHAFGEKYRFKTPVYAVGTIQDKTLHGNLILVGQGDLTFGGRQDIGGDTLAYTKMDHTYANDLPGAILTPQNPLNALNALAQEIKKKGILHIEGDVLIDDRLFQTTVKRGLYASPIMINENLIDIIINPITVGKNASIHYRPAVPGYTVHNTIQTVDASSPLDLTMRTEGKQIYLSGNVPENQKNVIRTVAIQNPAAFAKAAFIQALKEQGIHIQTKKGKLPPTYANLQPIAVWTSPPLFEYGQLILKVSHNLGANLIPLLLASQKGQKTFDQGMLLFGNFVTDIVKVSPESFVFIDGAGGDENRLTPLAEITLLDYMRTLPNEQFQRYMKGMPILGVDGSLQDYEKTSPAKGHVYAKPGTGISYNLATDQFFLTTQALSGYIKAKNGHLLEFMFVANNGNMHQLTDVFSFFEDDCKVAAELYNQP